jgi:hypothetical protein
MKISFDLQLADLVAFVRYHDSHSPRVRWTRAIAAVVVLAPFVILPLVFLPTEYRPAALAAVAVGAFVSAFRMPAAFDRGVERNVRKLYSGPKGANTFGMHELELTDTSLIKRTDYIESTTRFAALGPVICAKNYTFVYVGPTTAFVIPRHTVRSGDFDQFTAAIAERVAAANPMVAR